MPQSRINLLVNRKWYLCLAAHGESSKVRRMSIFPVTILSEDTILSLRQNLFVRPTNDNLERCAFSAAPVAHTQPRSSHSDLLLPFDLLLLTLT